MEIDNLQNCNNNESELVYTVADIKDMLGIGKNQAYTLVNSGEFHICHIGKKIVIPKIAFENWLLGNDKQDQLQSGIVS